MTESLLKGLTPCLVSVGSCFVTSLPCPLAKPCPLKCSWARAPFSFVIQFDLLLLEILTGGVINGTLTTLVKNGWVPSFLSACCSIF